MNERWWTVVGIGLALALGLVGRLVAHPAQPARRDPATAEAWMADALPGIGAKRLDPAVDSLRAGRFDELPKQARSPAREAFSAP